MIKIKMRKNSKAKKGDLIALTKKGLGFKAQKKISGVKLMKIPKKIKMFGFDWKVVINKESGGSYNWIKKEIILGNKYGEASNILVHEILEAVLGYQHCRFYGNEENQEYQFIFNHTQLCNIGQEFANILKDNSLLNL